MTEMRIPPAAAVTAVLAELAADGQADSVANQLRARGIKGIRMDECECPIARLLLTLRGVEQVEVDGTFVILPVGDGEVEIRLPDPVRRFTFHFDKGIYLDLVEIPAVSA